MLSSIERIFWVFVCYRKGQAICLFVSTFACDYHHFIAQECVGIKFNYFWDKIFADKHKWFLKLFLFNVSIATHFKVNEYWNSKAKMLVRGKNMWQTSATHYTYYYMVLFLKIIESIAKSNQERKAKYFKTLWNVTFEH